MKLLHALFLWQGSTNIRKDSEVPSPTHFELTRENVIPFIKFNLIKILLFFIIESWTWYLLFHFFIRLLVSDFCWLVVLCSAQVISSLLSDVGWNVDGDLWIMHFYFTKISSISPYYVSEKGCSCKLLKAGRLREIVRSSELLLYTCTFLNVSLCSLICAYWCKLSWTDMILKISCQILSVGYSVKKFLSYTPILRNQSSFVIYCNCYFLGSQEQQK